MQENNSFYDRVNNRIASSITIKLLSVGFLILLLIIPANMVESLIAERNAKHIEAIDEIGNKWGSAQMINGPLLNIPYHTIVKDKTGTDSTGFAYAHFLPASLLIKGVLIPEVRYRGIYKAIVYHSTLHIEGTYSALDFKGLDIPERVLMKDKAYISFGIPDMRGIKEMVLLDWNGKKYPFNPGIDDKDITRAGLSVRIPFNEITENSKFSIDLSLNGSQSINFIPLGKETDVEVNSSWKDPSFTGAFLPDKHNISSSGFTAYWKVLHLNRNFPQQWVGNSYSPAEAAFGVNLLIPVDVYQQTLRTAKYAILLISLSFLIFFFIEVLNKKRIHPFQYILVGIALCIFYTLLLSLSEYIYFGLAYFAASVATVGLIGMYSDSMFNNRRLAVIFAGVLSLLFIFIYVIIQLEDLALLIGSIGLFSVLSIVMYLSRKVNWYNVSTRQEIKMPPNE